MSIFKNPNETSYVGEKKHWTDVIKNSGDGELLIWRQPEEDFNTNSTLIVMPGEEAIFIKDGTVEQVFSNGTYKLSTDNYPFIGRLRNAFSGGVSTFSCVVYFVRKSDSAEILWGTDSPIQLRDKVWEIRTDARARGSYKVRIENAPLFLQKLIGNNVPFKSQQDLDLYFRNEFQGKIKTVLSKFLNALEIELIGLEAFLEEFSEKIHPAIDEILSEYGLSCIKFTLSAIDIDTTKYDIIDASQIELVARKRGYMGDKASLEILGEDWAKLQGMNLLKDLANNPGAGGTAAAGAGIGMGIGAAGAFGAIAQQVFAPAVNELTQQQTQKPVPSGRFTQKSAVSEQSQESAPAEDPTEVLGKLKKLLDAGLIEQSEYDAKKSEILSRL